MGVDAGYGQALRRSANAVEAAMSMRIVHCWRHRACVRLEVGIRSSRMGGRDQSCTVACPRR